MTALPSLPEVSALNARDAEIGRVVDGLIDSCDRFERAVATITSAEEDAKWLALFARLRGEDGASLTTQEERAVA